MHRRLWLIGEPYQYLALWGTYGPSGARIQQFFAHSLHGIFGLGAGGFQGSTLVLDDSVTVGGRPVVQQYRFTRPAGGRFAQANRRSIDNGATWIVTLRATFRRTVAPD